MNLNLKTVPPLGSTRACQNTSSSSGKGCSHVLASLIVVGGEWERENESLR